MKHVHHDMIVAWAADPSQVVEVRANVNDVWLVTEEPKWVEVFDYRFKPAEPKYITVNGVNVPEPVREPLEKGRVYWLASTAFENSNLAWHDNPSDLRWLSLGLIHLTKEAAQAHIDAMLLPSRTDK